MTEATQRRFYFPRWNAALKARWIRASGVMLPRPNAPQNEFADQVLGIAEARARKRQALVSPDDLRHACHVLALGKDLSSYDMTSWQTDRVAVLFELLVDPENLSARMRWESPDQDAVRRLHWSIQRVGFPEAYIAHVSWGKFGTKAWRTLQPLQLRQLLITLKSRAAAKRNSSSKNAEGGTENHSSVGRVERAGGSGHRAPGATVAPACDEGMPGPEEGGDPF
ncbi:MAG: hypothetical protein KIT22_10125 [Verrucomicrobiae bacterium]|nr:hypothetical protein [Verrucomicrobiae bacterium]